MRHVPLLIDASRVPDPCCVDDALEILHKSISEPPDGDLWAPHHSPFIRELIERFTQFGLARQALVAEELQAWLDGARSQVGPPSPRPAAAGQLTAAELQLARIYLAHLPIEQWSFWDYSLLVDYLFGSYLPVGTLRSEAEKLAVQASVMGRVQALHPALELVGANAVVAALPATVLVAQAQFRLPAVAKAVMDYGYAHCAEAVVSTSDAFRHKLKTIIMEHEGQVLFGEKPRQALQSKLLDALGTANRDWRMIALTEAGELANQGFVAAQEIGARVRRHEAYKGACPFCRKIDGRVMNIVAADDPKKDGETDIWPGKTNQGRSASPMKRGIAGLVERPKDEQWWVPSGTVHPHCRGSWSPVIGKPKGVSDDFANWLDQHLAQGRAAP